MEKRHTHWVNLWNANCDSDNPRPKRDLLKELDAWEKSQSSNQSSTVMRKDFDNVNWSKGHNDHFKDLIAQARSRGQAKLNNTIDKPSEGSDQKDSVMNDLSDETKIVDDQGAAKQMHKLVVSQTADESTTDDDSLYRAGTPPRQSSNLSQSSTTTKGARIFQTSEDTVEDIDMTAK